MKIKFLTFITIILIVLSLITKINAWSSNYWVFGETHKAITTQAFTGITQNEFPDLIKFMDELKNGSNTEAHAPPNQNIPGSSVTSPHRCGCKVNVFTI